MKKIPGCLVVMNLTALVWLCTFTQAGLAAGHSADLSFRPIKAEVSSSNDAASPSSEPAAKAAPRGSSQQAGDARMTTIELAPITEVAQAEQRNVKRSKKAEKMPPTQSYPPLQVQPAPDTVESGPKSSDDKKSGRNDKRRVTTIEMPRKQPDNQSGGRYGKKPKAMEEPSVTPPASQPGHIQPYAPYEAPGKNSRSTKKTRKGADRNKAAYEATPPTAPARLDNEPGGKSRRSKDRTSRSRTITPTPDPNQTSVVALPGPAPEPAGSRSKKRRETRTPMPDPNPPSVAPIPGPAPEPAGSRSKNRRTTRIPMPDPNPPSVAAMPGPAPQPVGPKSKKRRESRSAAPVAAALPVLPGPAAGLTPEQEMTRAYQAFDLVYSGSLGKTRKELNDLWGFPMQKMGENAREVAYGFRQKGLLNLPEAPSTGRGAAKKKAAPTYYAANTMDPSLPGQYFSCLVVLWVDNKGRGVVVDGEAVGDCFIVETLSRRPEHFER